MLGGELFRGETLLAEFDLGVGELFDFFQNFLRGCAWRQLGDDQLPLTACEIFNLPTRANFDTAASCLINLADLRRWRDDLPATRKVRPDFPGGGQIITPPAQISEIYQAGRGSVKVRARWKIEDLARGQWQLIVTELPPGTSAQKILEEIEELTNPKVKLGKKSLTPEQLATKQTILGVLDTVRDESGREAPVRLVFEPKSKNQDQEEFSNLLLAHTSLENNAAINLVMIGADGRPRQKGLGDILRESSPD